MKITTKKGVKKGILLLKSFECCFSSSNFMEKSL